MVIYGVLCFPLCLPPPLSFLSSFPMFGEKTAVWGKKGHAEGGGNGGGSSDLQIIYLHLASA